MNKKEIAEIRRRLAPDKNAIDRIYGCYVNEKKEIVSTFSKSLQGLPEDEENRYMSIFKRTLSGQPGRNQFEIAFRPDQVEAAPHKLLMGLRETSLADGAEMLCHRIIDSLELDENYLILMMHDCYDVPRKNTAENHSDVILFDDEFNYIIVAICPVKQTKTALGYFPSDEEFHTIEADLAVNSPELGFMFPAFDDRTSNIYAAQFYTRDAANIHAEFIDGVFESEVPLSIQDQRQAFYECLSDGLVEELRYDVVQTIHDNLMGQFSEHKKDAEPLEISRREVVSLLKSCEVAPEKIAAFESLYRERFGEGVGLPAASMIDQRQFVVETENAKISVDPDRSDLITARRIDGLRYILVQVEGDVSVNGTGVEIP